MTGQVENHTESDGFSNLEIHFTENPFFEVDYEDIYNPSKTNIGLDLWIPYEIVYIDEIEDIHNFYEGQNWQWFGMGIGNAEFGLWTFGLTQFKLETTEKQPLAILERF